MFLYYEDGDIKVREDSKSLEEVQRLYRRDRTGPQKSFFRDCITFLYYVYCRDSVFRNIYTNERKQEVIRRYMPKRETKDFEDNKEFIKLRDFYIDIQYSIQEKLLMRCEQDMEDIIKQLSEVPLYKDVYVQVPIKDDEGVESGSRRVKVQMDNSEEKFKLIQLAEKVIDYQAKLREKMKRDENRKRVQTRLFDK